MTFAVKIETADPVHLQLERFLRKELREGRLAPGQRLPTTVELARIWHVDCTTVQRAITPLVAEGLVERRPRRGTFVTNTAARGKGQIAIL
ncbi:MAG: winged helix-turn-helix domain-containing protein, partial [Kiritimatiellae bacterium]|nr:winged helix-turn-helix domain-containing protein [Kiritimatiellia bacterium]